ncbi:uncharacterized protein K460DRAFT_139389 [Cucurbitaria berberidis CBS 394.84]|uniref:Uncharacterized protein n=1 Tax=Cucurbitaria berberidis CBS 394.84 TaxID=1168544 RepID=A0A9P4L5L5_9PLEO|nr:uncharacterized protein K460DRAFT_139389 [Cucurbitaria berberidis CBS 394.84]KAF1843081.1 hypothetical protein K460DRAFT_139389 [Cucurbitaria berberidis CBS 394.84]
MQHYNNGHPSLLCTRAGLTCCLCAVELAGDALSKPTSSPNRAVHPKQTPTSFIASEPSRPPFKPTTQLLKGSHSNESRKIQIRMYQASRDFGFGFHGGHRTVLGPGLSRQSYRFLGLPSTQPTANNSTPPRGERRCHPNRSCWVLER